jgi:hypothetical protein
LRYIYGVVHLLIVVVCAGVVGVSVSFAVVGVFAQRPSLDQYCTKLAPKAQVATLRSVWDASSYTVQAHLTYIKSVHR